MLPNVCSRRKYDFSGACDGLVQKEIDLLETIANYIGLSKTDSDSIMAQFRPNNNSNYRILGITPSATDDEVRKAYRRMAVQYHPDKVATLGTDVQKAAEEKFKAISQAYEAICANAEFSQYRISS